MKRYIGLITLTGALLSAASAQIRIYDTIYAAGGPPTTQLTGLTFVGGTPPPPRTTMGDGINVSLINPVQVTQFNFVLVVTTAVTNAFVDINVEFYNDWNPSGQPTDPAFGNFAGAISGRLTGINTTGAAAFIITTIPSTPIILNTNPNKGVVIKLSNGIAAANNATVGVVNRLPSPGSEGPLTDVFYLDLNNNGVISVNEAVTFGGGRLQDNLAMTLFVPEPASMLALSAGLAGLVGLRRRKK